MSKRNQTAQDSKSYDAMLKEALARPGVREVMEVYQNWQKADQQLDSYRVATMEVIATGASNNANVS